MRNPIAVLESLEKQTKRSTYRFQRLYRNLYNPEFYLLAYSNIYAKPGNMTPGVDGKTIDGMSLKRVEKLIDSLKDYSYQPSPSKRISIPKKNGGKRPLGIPSFEDKLVQEIIRMILEHIYESDFSSKSHGFRPNKSCHTALTGVQQTFTGVKWFIEGDIKGFFDNIDHHILTNLLRKKISDESFIHLIWKFLRAGYLEDWKLKSTYSGSPQGGLISPVLSNIYLSELDKYIASYKKKFDKGKARKRLTEYRTRESRLTRARAKYRETWESLTAEQKEHAKNHIKELKAYMMEVPYKDPMDDTYRRIQYIRYADDFLIGVIGNKEDCVQIKTELTNYLQASLKLELSNEKTKITHSTNRARFLGYDIKISHDNKTTKTTTSGYKQRTRSMVCELLMPHEVVRDKLLEYKAMIINPKTNLWKPTHRAFLLRNDELEIINVYNAEIRGMYNYYCLASNVYKLDSFKYIMEYSMYRTLANKYKSSIRKINKKYRIDGKFGIRYSTKSGMKVCYFYDGGFKKSKDIIRNSEVDNANPIGRRIAHSRNSLIKRLLARKCEWCDEVTDDLEIHHIKKLKDLKGKIRWEIKMIERKRKTMALCKECHRKLHNGQLD